MILGTWSELGQWGAASVVIGPTAVITGDLSVNEGERAYLSAGTSIAGTYPIVSYQWASLDGYTINNPGASSADLDPSASVGGNAQVRLTVTDSEGNTDSTTVSIAVADIAPPVITPDIDGTITIATGETWPDPTATVTDNVDATRTIYSDTRTLDTASASAGSITFTATDAAGNTSTVTQQYQVLADYSDIIEIVAQVPEWEVENDGSILAFKDRRNREKFRFKPSDPTGLVVDSEGYFDFSAPYVDKLEIIMQGGILDTTTNSILIEGTYIKPRLGDFGSIASKTSGKLVFVLYVGGDTQGTVIASDTQRSDGVTVQIDNI